MIHYHHHRQRFIYKWAFVAFGLTLWREQQWLLDFPRDVTWHLSQINISIIIIIIISSMLSSWSSPAICHWSISYAILTTLRLRSNFFGMRMDGNWISNLILGQQLQPKHVTLITISTIINIIINHHHVIVMIAPLTYSNNPLKYQRHKCHI